MPESPIRSIAMQFESASLNRLQSDRLYRTVKKEMGNDACKMKNLHATFIEAVERYQKHARCNTSEQLKRCTAVNAMHGLSAEERADLNRNNVRMFEESKADNRQEIISMFQIIGQCSERTALLLFEFIVKYF